MLALRPERWRRESSAFPDCSCCTWRPSYVENTILSNARDLGIIPTGVADDALNDCVPLVGKQRVEGRCRADRSNFLLERHPMGMIRHISALTTRQLERRG